MSNWQTYQSPHLGFTLNVPEEWTKEEDASGTIVLFSPVKTCNYPYDNNTLIYAHIN
jgi:hypothetical protein